MLNRESARTGNPMPQEVKQLCEQGLTLATAGRYDEALAIFKEALLIKPQQMEVFAEMGRIYHAQGLFSEAVQSYEKAIGLAPGNPVVYNNLGFAFQAQRRLVEAEKCYQQALKLQSNYPKARMNLATLYQAQNRLEEAIGGYQEILRITPGDAPAALALADIFRQQGKLEEAQKAYKAAIGKSSDEDAQAYHGLGQIAMAQKRYDKAVPAYQKAIQLQPDFAVAYSNLGLAYLMKNALKPAGVCLEKALQLAPHRADVYSAYGDVMRLSGRQDLAVQYYQKSLSLGAIQAETYSSLGVCYTHLGQFEAAQKALERAQTLQPTHIAPYFNMALLKEAQGLWEEAEVQYRNSLDRDPQGVRTHTRLGMLLLQRSHSQEGWTDYAWRTRNPALFPALPSTPAWNGKASLKGKTVLVVGEADISETLQAVRFLSKLKHKGAHVMLAVQTPWMGVFEALGVAHDVLPREAQVAELPCDYWVAALDLAYLLGSPLESLCEGDAVLKIPTKLITPWKKQLGASKKPMIGLALPEESAQTVMAATDATHLKWASLTPGLSAPDLLDVAGAGADPMQLLGLLATLDGVVTTDTPVAQLAALLGKPVWVLREPPIHWRWDFEGQNNQWFPAMQGLTLEDLPTLSARIAERLAPSTPKATKTAPKKPAKAKPAKKLK